MYKACLKYPKWKSSHNPDYKPWSNPECLRIPRIDWNDIKTLNSTDINNNNNIEDESQITEKDLDKTDLNDDSNDQK